VDAVRAVLDFLRSRYDGDILIAEGPATQPADEGFQRYGYDTLAREYGANLLDLNRDEPRAVTVYDRRLQPLRLQIARSVADSDFRISVGPPKTHDVVIVTLSLKNMIMGSLISRVSHLEDVADRSERDTAFGKVSHQLARLVPQWVRRLPPFEWAQFRVMSTLQPSDKMKMHQSYPVINLNLALLAPRVAPHLSVIDAYEAMEGNGPTEGTPVPMRMALVSTNALAADLAGTASMGFYPRDVGYLHYCMQMGLGPSSLDEVEIIGDASLEQVTRAFRPHATYMRQRRWHLADADRYLIATAAQTF
jgi:uncharacterized protein (DUF362 family)